jgi:hypothetical protein
VSVYLASTWPVHLTENPSEFIPVAGEPPAQLKLRVASVLVSTEGAVSDMLLKYSPGSPVPVPTAVGPLHAVDVVVVDVVEVVDVLVVVGPGAFPTKYCFKILYLADSTVTQSPLSIPPVSPESGFMHQKVQLALFPQ